MINSNYTIITTCPFCGKKQKIHVNSTDYVNWQNGELAQNAFPYLSADAREALISGICSNCWDNMFSAIEVDNGEDFDWDYNEDEGFDPYEGYYTWDC